MSRWKPQLLAGVVVALAICARIELCAALFALDSDPDASEHSDIPGKDNAVIKRTLSPRSDIVGEWQGFELSGYDRSNLTIKTHPEKKGVYELEFVRKMDAGKPRRTTRTAKFDNGILTLDEPVEGFSLSTPKYGAIFVVRSNGKEYLVPSVHAKNLKREEDLSSDTAYERRPHPAKKRRR